MQQFQSLIRLLLFYALTLLIMLCLYYAALYIGIMDNSKNHSVEAFDNLQHDITEHLASLDYDVDAILKKPYLQDLSYQLILMSPSGQTYIHTNTRPNETELITISFPDPTLPPKNSYQLDNEVLKATISLEDGYKIHILLRHQTPDINWTSYLYWLPLVIAIVLFMMALFYTLRRQANWQQLLTYTDNLSEDAKEAYSSTPFIVNKSTSEFLRLGYTLSRVKYQLHNNHRRIQVLQHRLERLVDSAPLPMLMIMRKGDISFFNQRFEQVFTTSYQSDISYKLIDFFTGNDKTTQQLLLDLSAQRVTRTLLVYGLENNQPYQLHITPWFGEHGQVRGFTALLNNVSSFIEQSKILQKNNQNLEAQVKSFTELRSVIGHELRTPLNAIISTLDMMEQETFNIEQQEILSTLTQSSQSMLAMLNDMLDMAKIEAGRVDIVSESKDIFKLGQHVSDLMLSATRRQNIDLLYYFDPICPRYISTDGSRLCQILLNLMDNAVKFTQSGYVALTIEGITQQQMAMLNQGDKLNKVGHNRPTNPSKNRAFAKSQNSKLLKSSSDTVSTDEVTHADAINNTGTNPEYQWIRFSVKDSGIGIAATDQHKLFSYFNQANPQINQKFGGTGLGLAISNSFAQLLGGFIQLDSEIGCGSTFNLYIPCRSPIYEPVYHFHSDLLHIHLIAVVDQALRETYLQRIGNYLFMNISIYSELNPATIARLEQQLTQQQPGVTSILMLDYDCYQDYDNNLRSQSEALNIESIDNSDSINDSLLGVPTQANHTLQEMINNTKLPKILLSRKPERSIPSDTLEEFDGFLNKPINVTLMISELIRLAQNQVKLPPSLPTASIVVKDKFTARNESNIDDVNFNINEAIESNTLRNMQPQEQAEQPLILVVEDNITNQKITCKLLSKLGYRSVVAENGEQALSLLKVHRQQLALILMDCRMPVMDGLTATRAIRDSGDNITIIALTANDSPEDKISCQQVGMDEFLTKPIQKNKLATMLKHFIKA